MVIIISFVRVLLPHHKNNSAYLVAFIPSPFKSSFDFWECFLLFLQKLCCSVYLGPKNPICHFNCSLSVWRELCAPLNAEIQQPCGWKMSNGIQFWETIRNHSWIACYFSLRTVGSRSSCKLCDSNSSSSFWGLYLSLSYMIVIFFFPLNFLHCQWFLSRT